MKKGAKPPEPRPGARQQKLELVWDEQPNASPQPGEPEDAQNAETPQAEREAALPPQEPPREPDVPSEPSEGQQADEQVAAAPEPPPPDDKEPPGEPRTAEHDVRIVELGQVTMTVGQALQEARAAGNLTIAQVSQQTKIQKQIIEQLESDQLDRLPSPFYARAYISRLCREYAIEDGPVLQEYSRATGEPQAGSDVSELVVTTEETDAGPIVTYQPGKRLGKGRPQSSKATTYVVASVIAVVALLMILSLIFGRDGDQRDDTGEDNDLPAERARPAIDLEKFVIPQQLPLKELPVPEK